MGIFGGSKEKNKPILVFSVGSSKVGASFFYGDGKANPKIISIVEEDIPVEAELNIERFLYETVKAIETVSKKLLSQALGAPEKIYCILSSPLYISQTRWISTSKNTPFVFTDKVADELIQKEIKLFNEEYSKQNPDFASTMRPIELKNVRTIINGYEVLAPLNQKVRELEMAVRISISGEETLKNIEDAVRQYFHFDQIKFLTSAMVNFAIARDLDTKNTSFLLVDIDGEVTDIAMVKKNALQESHSFPQGFNFVSRGLAQGLGKSVPEAMSLFSLYTARHMDESAAQKFGEILDGLRKEWIKSFEEALANLTHDISIPSLIYLKVPQMYFEFFSETIKTDQMNQYTFTESKFEIVSLSAEKLSKALVLSAGVKGELEQFLGPIYINRYIMSTHG